MILRLTVCGLVIVLIAVIAISYYSNREGFETLNKLMDRKIVRGRYIKIEQKQQGCINLADIEVYSNKISGNIVRKDMVISQSSPGAPATNLLDGNKDTIGHNNCNDIGWFLLDLGEVLPIYKIVITNRKDCCRERANGISVSILNGSTVIYKSNPFKDTKGRTSYTELGGNNATMNEYYYTFTLFPPYPNVFGDLPSTMDFDTASNIDVVKGWSRTNPLEDPTPMLTNETPESCRQMALESNGKYVAWGYRKDNHPTDLYKNTCYLYKSGFGPFSGDGNDDIHLTGCVNPGEKVDLGCKVPPSSTPSNTPSSNTPSGTVPTREDVKAEVKVSEITFDAMKLQNEVNRLNNIQKMLRMDVLANREILQKIETEKAKLTEQQQKAGDTASTLQGKEYEDSSLYNNANNECYEGSEYRCPKNPDGSCPPVPDMTKYIKKNNIPCWGCNIDY